MVSPKQYIFHSMVLFVQIKAKDYLMMNKNCIMIVVF